MLTPVPQLGEELWARIRRRWRKGRVVAVRTKNLQLALLRPMPESPLTKEVTVGWAYVETEHEIRRERPAEGLALEWQTPESESDGSPPVGEIEAWDGESSVSRSPSSGG